MRRGEITHKERSDGAEDNSTPSLQSSTIPAHDNIGHPATAFLDKVTRTARPLTSKKGGRKLTAPTLLRIRVPATPSLDFDAHGMPRREKTTADEPTTLGPHRRPLDPQNRAACTPSLVKRHSKKKNCHPLQSTKNATIHLLYWRRANKPGSERETRDPTVKVKYPKPLTVVTNLWRTRGD